LSKFVTAAAEASALESRVGHYYQMDGTYLVGREKVREYARAVQDYHPAHWDVAAAAELGYSDLVAPLTFTSVPGMTCNRRMFESVVVGYDTYVQTEEVFEQHRPIVADDELHIDVELTSVRSIAGRELITVTNTFTDTAGERVHTLHTTVVGLTAEDVDPAIKSAVQKAMMHDVNILGSGESDSDYQKSVRPEAEVRIAKGGTTRTPGTPSFDNVKVGDELPVHQARLSRGDLVNYAGVAGDANPIHWDENLAKVAGLPDVIAHGMLTMGLGAGFASAWTGDPGAVTRYAVRLSQPAIVSAIEGAAIEYSGRIKSLDPATRTGVVIVGAKSGGRKIFGLATLTVRFR
jgi:acyl dehydratase